jgi:hypothetical protein
MEIKEFEEKRNADELVFIKDRQVKIPYVGYYIDKKTGEILEVHYKIPTEIAQVDAIWLSDCDDDVKQAIEELEEEK